MMDLSRFSAVLSSQNDPLQAEIWRKPVTVGESVRINKQLFWVAGLAEGQGGD
jgi:hypothetical protein